MKVVQKASLAVLLLLPVLLIGCGNDDNPAGTTNDEAPALPDQSSMSVDNSAFESTPSASVGSTGTKDTPPIVEEDYQRFGGPFDKGSPAAGVAADSAGYANYVAGRTVAAAANVAVVVFSAAPSAALAGASLAVPQAQADGSWNWSYAVTYGYVTYNLVLNGKAASSGTNWSMRVSTTGLSQNLSNFLWFSGQTQSGGNTGYWQLYDPTFASAPTNLIRVDWNRVSATNRSAVWQNNRVGGTAYGDNLTYAQSGSEASIDYADVSEATASFVRWNTDTSAGSVRVPVFNGGAEACWDASHLNTSCAQ